VIFEESAASDELYIIAQGEVDIQVDTYPQVGYRIMRNLAADLALKIRTTDLRIREELLYGQRRR
jgi:hypothetical protein